MVVKKIPVKEAFQYASHRMREIGKKYAEIKLKEEEEKKNKNWEKIMIEYFFSLEFLELGFNI